MTMSPQPPTPPESKGVAGGTPTPLPSHASRDVPGTLNAGPIVSAPSRSSTMAGGATEKVEQERGRSSIGAIPEES